jgi:hypothetical protein
MKEITVPYANTLGHSLAVSSPIVSTSPPSIASGVAKREASVARSTKVSFSYGCSCTCSPMEQLRCRSGHLLDVYDDALRDREFDVRGRAMLCALIEQFKRLLDNTGGRHE